MNQRQLVRNYGKITILQNGGKARMANKIGRQDSVVQGRHIDGQAISTCCVLL